MREPIYVVRIGGKLYIQGNYSLYPATTPNIMAAKFFRDYRSAEKAAKKARGEVIELFVTDEVE